MLDDRQYIELVKACFPREPLLYRNPALVADKAAVRLDVMAGKGQFGSSRYRDFHKLCAAARERTTSARAAQ